VALLVAACVGGCDCYGTTPADDGLDASLADAGLDASLADAGDGSEADAAGGCYSGPAETRGLGECRDGELVCEGGQCDVCTGEVLPAIEVCNLRDDDCDGATDEDAPPVCGDGCHCVDVGAAAGFDVPSAVAENVVLAEDGSLALAGGSDVGTWRAEFFAYEACFCNAFLQVHPQADLPDGSSIVVHSRQWESSEGSPGEWETVGVYPGGPTVDEMPLTGDPAFCSTFYTEIRFELHAAPDGQSPRLTCFWLEPLCWLC
jgi:hypothetical protein